MLRTLCGEWIDMLLTGAQLGCGDVERCRKCRSEMEVRGLRVVRLSKQARRQLALDALGAE